MQYLLSCRQAPVRSCPRTSSRANAVSVGRHRVTTVATARPGAGGRKVSCSAVASAERTQSGGGGRSDGQDKRTGGGGDSEGSSEALGRWQVAIRAVGRWLSPLDVNVVATIFAGAGVLVWHKGLATTGDVESSEKRLQQIVASSEGRMKECVESSEGRMKTRVDEKVGEVKTRVDEKVGEVKTRVDEVKERVESMQQNVEHVAKSVDRLITGVVVVAVVSLLKKSAMQ